MQTTFEQLLTPYQQQQALDFIAQAKRVAAVVDGAQQMGMDVPDLDVLCNMAKWEGPEAGGRRVDMLVTVDAGFPWTFTAVHRDEWDTPQHFTAGLDGISEDTVYFAPEWDNVRRARRLSWADSTLELTATDLAHLERADAIGGAWISHLSRYLGAVLDLPYIGLLQPGVKGPDGSLYVAGEALQQTIFRPSGEVLDVGRGLSALKDPDAVDVGYTEADQATAARLQQLQGAGA